MRFDYPGTGDAPGGDGDGERTRAWLRGIDVAMDEVRARSGAQRVCLFGMRLGATLAAQAAASRGGIDGLVLVAPCVSGGAYLREVRAASKLRKRGRVRRFPGQQEGGEEALGFWFRGDTVAALTAIKLRELSARPAEHMLIVPRDDLPGQEAAIATRMAELGTRVVVREIPGYSAAMSDDPYFVDVPEQIWAAVADWLGATFAFAEPGLVGGDAPRTESLAFAEGSTEIRESIVRFGERGRLFGLLAEPASGRWDTGVIVSNTGANHRVGPNRLGISLTRCLAADGVAAMRIDLAGLGDSGPLADGGEKRLYASESAADVKAAIDALVARGCKNVLLVGLCSGGYVSFQAALTDTRVRGLVMIDPLAFAWREGDDVERAPSRDYPAARYYWRAAMRRSTWKRMVQGELDLQGVARELASRLASRVAWGMGVAAVRIGVKPLVATDLARKFASLLRRGTRVLVVFNGDEPMVDRFAGELGQLYSALRRRGLRIEMIEGADHVFVPIWSQHHVVGLVRSFARG